MKYFFEIKIIFFYFPFSIITFLILKQNVIYLEFLFEVCVHVCFDLTLNSIIFKIWALFHKKYIRRRK